MAKQSSNTHPAHPSPCPFEFTHQLAELSGSVQSSVENLQLLAELTDRGLSGEPLNLSFNASNALSRLLHQFAGELAGISDQLADA